MKKVKLVVFGAALFIIGAIGAVLTCAGAVMELAAGVMPDQQPEIAGGEQTCQCQQD